MPDDTRQNIPPRTPIYFGWWTVIVTGLVSGIGHGFYMYGLSIFFKDIAAELSLSRALTSLASGLGKLEGGLVSPPLCVLFVRRTGRHPFPAPRANSLTLSHCFSSSPSFASHGRERARFFFATSVRAKPPLLGSAIDLAPIVVMRQKLLKDVSISALSPIVSSM